MKARIIACRLCAAERKPQSFVCSKSFAEVIEAHTLEAHGKDRAFLDSLKWTADLARQSVRRWTVGHGRDERVVWAECDVTLW